MNVQPLLSLVIGSRNDDYGGNSRWRLQTTLNYLAASLESLGRLDDVEVVVVDWGSAAPLCCVLELTSAARRITRWIVVPVELAKRLEGDSEFPVVLAQNTGIRRARATFIGQMDADVLISGNSIAKLLRAIEGDFDLGVPISKTLAVAQRRDLPYSLVSGSPSFRQLDWVIDHLGHMLPGLNPKGVPYFGTGLILMHRELWQQCGAFDESLLYRGAMEIDLGARVTQRYPCILLNSVGVHIYHLTHHTSWHGLTEMRKHNRQPQAIDFRPNEANWGLFDYDIEEISERSSEASNSRHSRSDDLPVLSARLVTAVVLIFIRSLFRRAIPISVKRRWTTALILSGQSVRLLRGQPPSRWPGTLLLAYRQRQARRQAASH